MSRVNFVVGSYQKYAALETKDANTLYFLEDVGKIFKGSSDVTSDVFFVDSLESAFDTAVEGKLYISASTLECGFKSGGANIKLFPGYITDYMNWADDANGSKFATISVIKEALLATVNSIKGDAAFVHGLSYDSDSGTLVVENGAGETVDVPLTGVPYFVDYNADTLTLTIKACGAADTVINLPKDNFVKSGRYDAETGDIVLVIDDGDGVDEKEVRIPATSLVDVYEGGETGTVEVTVSEDNKITATAKISSTAGNALRSDETGLYVDISGKASKLDADESAVDHIFVRAADGDIKDSGETISTVIAAAVNAAKEEFGIEDLINRLSELSGTVDDYGESINTLRTDVDGLKDAINGYINKIDGTENNLVAVAADGQIKDSGKQIGSEELSETPDANTVATEIAVKTAIETAYSWGPIGV